MQPRKADAHAPLQRTTRQTPGGSRDEVLGPLKEALARDHGGRVLTEPVGHLLRLVFFVAQDALVALVVAKQPLAGLIQRLDHVGGAGHEAVPKGRALALGGVGSVVDQPLDGIGRSGRRRLAKRIAYRSGDGSGLAKRIVHIIPLAHDLRRPVHSVCQTAPSFAVTGFASG